MQIMQTYYQKLIVEVLDVNNKNSYIEKDWNFENVKYFVLMKINTPLWQ